MKFSTHVKSTLFEIIHNLSTDIDSFVKHPGIDFSRNRKLGFEKTICFLLSLSNLSTQDELLSFFDHHEHTPSLSALIQQRDKLRENLFPRLLNDFNSHFPGNKTYKGYKLLACDGSDANIFHNPNDKSTYYRNPGSEKGFNELHIDALYDLCNRTYQMINIDGRHDQNEQRALINFMRHYSDHDNIIFIADRNYECWNIFATAQKQDLKFLIRAKDITSNGILHTFHFDNDIGDMDCDININLTRQKRCIDKSNPKSYRVMATNVTFDYIKQGEEGVFPLTFRVVRFPISDDKYEAIITNLDRDIFPPDEIKQLYSMRWGIETSFRELKHTLALNKFHSKKVDHIHQEIFAKVIMYNFCSTITMHVAHKVQKKKHSYQINFSRAIKECKYFFSCKSGIDPPDVENIIQKYMLPIRLGRTNPRKVKIREKTTFLYR
ncbi:Transposase DDE domain-containing protein [Eubacterium uniforme]|uniref:Transposase DDE domain-containing protein n=1 Tax=Eubacterium uniforme TaxID=39495 RepID=A0A1T4V4F3_9FIRM|nr:IS4 family transposase [Eubacterium uniforme]SKA59764.1 Transposase DDE domain-containing protein [Eubacterium uniforme]